MKEGEPGSLVGATSPSAEPASSAVGAPAMAVGAPSGKARDPIAPPRIARAALAAVTKTLRRERS